jgi:hypothetical protein
MKGVPVSTTNTEDAMRWGPPHRSLHEAVARAIAKSDYYGGVLPHHEQAAAAAIRVCMAEAQQAVEALQRPNFYSDDLGSAGMNGWDAHEREALAALAALAEDTA